MAADVRDLGDTIGSALGRIAREATQSVSGNGHGKGLLSRDGGSPLAGKRGVIAGTALVAAAPLAAKGAEKLARSIGANASDAGEKLQQGAERVVKQAGSKAVGEQVEKAGGAGGIAKEAGKKLLPGGAGESSGGGGEGQQGVGKGRRMPVQQAVDVAVPLRVAYDQWTQFEEWPEFMHRVVRASQEDDCTVSLATKLWGFSRDFTAQISEQRPDERIQWEVNEGVTHSGVVTFHELAPRLTRVQVSLDVEPGSWLEKFARGARHVKRAVRADLARFKAYVEMHEEASGGWRGTIHEGEVVSERASSDGGSANGGRSSGESARSRGGGSQRSRSGRSSSGGRNQSGGRSQSGSRSRASSRSGSSRSGSSSRQRRS
jgi:uncharacterized membrane protein